MGGMRLLQRPRVTRAAVVFPAVAVLLASSGCATVVSGTAVLSAPQVGQPVQWGPCRPAGGGSGESVAVPTGAQCGKIAVPVDYDKPDGDQAVLALIRFPATGEKIGSLIINPGGPGESGIEAAAGIVEGLPVDVRERFDLVGFDPRGVGASTPAVWCNSDADNDRLRADPMVDYSPDGVQRIEGETKAFVQRCIDKMGPDFLANVGTASVAKDLDALRAAVGDDKLNYLGYSYGTRIGAAYAEAFPGNERSIPMPTRSRPTSTRPRRSRRPSTITQRTVLRIPTVRWAPTRPRRSTSTATCWIRWWTRRSRPAIRADCPTATRWSAPSWRCIRPTSGGT